MCLMCGTMCKMMCFISTLSLGLAQSPTLSLGPEVFVYHPKPILTGLAVRRPQCGYALSPWLWSQVTTASARVMDGRALQSGSSRLRGISGTSSSHFPVTYLSSPDPGLSYCHWGAGYHDIHEAPLCAQRTSTEEWKSLGNPSSSLLAQAGVEMRQLPMVSEKTSGKQLACHKVVHFHVGLLSSPAP